MKQIGEMWNLVFEWLGTGKKIMMGIGFLVVGILVNLVLQPKAGLTQGSFILFMMGALFLVNALFSKLTQCNINVLYYTLIFVVIYELGIFLMGDLDNNLTNLVSVWGPCFLFIWALQYVVLQVAGVERVSKRIVIAFFDTLVGVIAVVAAFFLPVWVAVAI